MKNRCKCTQCGLTCLNEDILEADNPFKSGYIIHGCPNCMEIDSIEACCEVEGCKEFYVRAEKWPDGVYRFSCNKHKPVT